LPTRPETKTIVLEALATLWPARFARGGLREEAPLGEDGLGLDSIEIVELIVECEERIGQPGRRAQDLLESGPMTLGQLIDELAA
jgi:acyl carrier protein